MEQVSEMASAEQPELLPEETAVSGTEPEPAAVMDPDPAGPAEGLGRLDRIIESVLFAAAAPLSLRRLTQILDGPTIKEVHAALGRLLQTYAPGQRGIQLHEVAGGYQFRTARENAEWVRAVFRDKPARLGRATLETLAIIAYKQPATRADLEAIRGVDVEGVLSSLLARRLIKIAGRKEAVGRPLLYATTPEFLEAFGLKDLNELPSLKELGPPPDADDVDPTATHEADAAADVPAETDASDEPAAEPCAADAAPAEDPQSGGDRLATQGGGDDPGGAGAGERPSSDAVGDEGESADGSHHD